MFTKTEKFLVAVGAIYLIWVIAFMYAQSPNPSDFSATMMTVDGYPLYMQPKNVSDLPDGHYTVYRRDAMDAYVILCQPGDKEFVYTVALRPTDDLGNRSPGERFTVYQGKINTPLAGPALRAA